jgi:hypothetical protein
MNVWNLLSDCLVNGSTQQLWYLSNDFPIDIVPYPTNLGSYKFNPLRTKRRLLYLNAQFVPCDKHLYFIIFIIYILFIIFIIVYFIYYIDYLLNI